MAVGIPDGNGGFVYQGTPEYDAQKAKIEANKQARLVKREAERAAAGWGKDPFGAGVDPYGWQYGSPYTADHYRTAYSKGIILPTSVDGGRVNFGPITGNDPAAGTGKNAYGWNDVVVMDGGGYMLIPGQGGGRASLSQFGQLSPTSSGGRQSGGSSGGSYGGSTGGGSYGGNSGGGNSGGGSYSGNYSGNWNSGGSSGGNSGGLMDGNPNQQWLGDIGDYGNDFYAHAQEAYGQAANIGPDSYEIDAPQAQVYTRDVTDNELAGNQLNALLDPNSPLAKRAMQEGKDLAASRGLMNSSIAGGNAYGAWIDRVQPYALDQAAAYQRAASENMGAQNTGALADASAKLQARLQSANLNAGRDSELRGYQLGKATDLNRALLNIEAREDAQRYGTYEREAGQAWQTGERIGTQGWQSGENAANRTWQTGERIGTQGWQSGENAADRSFQSGENAAQRNWQGSQNAADRSLSLTQAQMQEAISYANISQQDRQIYMAAWSAVQQGQYASIAQAAAQIYANTDLTPAQQQQAVQNMLGFFSSIAPQLPNVPGNPNYVSPYYTPPGGYQPVPTNTGPPVPDNSNGSIPGPTPTEPGAGAGVNKGGNSQLHTNVPSYSFGLLT